MINYLLIVLQVFINTTAQLILKKGVNYLDFKQPVLSLMFAMITNIYVGAGLFIFAASFILWLYLLSQFELSFLYPFGSLSFVLAALGGYFFFGEMVSVTRWIGIFLILLGVSFIAKS